MRRRPVAALGQPSGEQDCPVDCRSKTRQREVVALADPKRRSQKMNETQPAMVA